MGSRATVIIILALINKEMEKQQTKSSEGGVIIPAPVYYTSISFDDEGTRVDYTDCWEISVLRLLHFLFGKDGVIS